MPPAELLFIISLFTISHVIPPAQFLNKPMSEYINSENTITSIIRERYSQVQTIERRFWPLYLLSKMKAKKEQYVENPLAAMVLVRRLAEDWTSMVTLAGGRSVLTRFGIEKERFPNNQDVISACFTLARIQDVYYLRTEDLAQGVIANSPVTTNVTAADCFNMGVYNYDDIHFPEATQWLQQALKKISSGDRSADLQTVMKYLAPSLCFSGDTKASIRTVNEFQRFNSFNILPESLTEHYQEIALKACDYLEEFKTVEKLQDLYKKQNEGSEDYYKELCQEEWWERSDLQCRYVDYQQPHLRFQPFKLEELQLDPPVIRFYDVISDKESARLKTIATIKMTKAKTLNANGSTEESHYRTSHFAWLHDNVDEVAARLSRRIADITQLDVSKAEEHQLSRYSVGGEFLPHTDCFTNHKNDGIFYIPFRAFFKVPFQEDRMATLMFYLNNVKQGGHTVFLQWGLSVRPVKNSAILWFHFHPRGEEDENSEHSGCPVLEGSKWVLNKWILNGGNEFRMSCGLNKNSSYKKYYIKRD